MIAKMRTTTLPNIKHMYRAELDRSDGMKLDELLKCSICARLRENARTLLVDNRFRPTATARYSIKFKRFG
jgi:hypothetical protein